MQIISTCLKRTSDLTKINLPNPTNFTRMIQRTRYTKDDNPKLPTNLNDIEIPDKLKVGSNNESFLYHDSGPRPNKFILYAKKKNLKFLKKCDTWVMEGTFDSAPLLFHQVSNNYNNIFLFL